MKVKDPETFALAVVQSSSADLSLQEKLDLYLEAKQFAKSYNENQQKSDKGGVSVFN